MSKNKYIYTYIYTPIYLFIVYSFIHLLLRGLLSSPQGVVRFVPKASARGFGHGFVLRERGRGIGGRREPELRAERERNAPRKASASGEVTGR